jgi:hypothetical protein
MNALALHEIADIMENAFSEGEPVSVIKRLGYARVASRKHLVTLFDRQRRIDLLWELFLVGMLVLLTFVLFAGAVH